MVTCDQQDKVLFTPKVLLGIFSYKLGIYCEGKNYLYRSTVPHMKDGGQYCVYYRRY